MGVCTHDGLITFGSRKKFIAKINKKTPNVVGSHFVIHREALGSRTLPIGMKDKFETIIRAINCIKASAVYQALQGYGFQS